jgi:hypothetical protein
MPPAQIKKQRKKIQKSLIYGRKISFSAILKIAANLKTCEKNFLIFQNFQVLMLIENVIKNK